MNSRIVTIIFETENLFFPARETIRLFTDGIRSWGERGLRFLPMSAPAVPVPGALRRPEKRVRAVLGRRLGPARSGWFPVRSGASLLAGLYPFQPAAASGICAGRGRRPPVPREPDSGGGHVHAEALPPVPAAAPLCRPCPQVPASLHAPASCSASGPAGSPGPGGGLSRRCGISAAAEGAGLPPAAGRCSPGHGPAADAHALGTARMAWTGGLSERGPGVGAVVSPAGDHPFHRRGRRPPASCRLPRPRRGGGDPVRKPK